MGFFDFGIGNLSVKKPRKSRKIPHEKRIILIKQRKPLKRRAWLIGGKTFAGTKQTKSQRKQVARYKEKERKKTKRTLRRAYKRLI